MPQGARYVSGHHGDVALPDVTRLDSQGVRIRRARRRDWMAIRYFFNRHFPEELPFPRLDNELWDLYRDMLVADAEGKIVAASWVRYRAESSVCWLDFIAVESTHRKCGIGTRLLEELEQAALAAGASQIGLVVLRDNAQALRLYEHRGFVIVSSTERGHQLARDIATSSDAVSARRWPRRRNIFIRAGDRGLYLLMRTLFMKDFA